MPVPPCLRPRSNVRWVLSVPSTNLLQPWRSVDRPVLPPTVLLFTAPIATTIFTPVTIATSFMVTLLVILSMASRGGHPVALPLLVLHATMVLVLHAAMVLPLLPVTSMLLILGPLPALLQLTTCKGSPRCMMSRLLCPISQPTNTPEFLLPSVTVPSLLPLLRLMLFLVRILPKVCFPLLLVLVNGSLTVALRIILPIPPRVWLILLLRICHLFLCPVDLVSKATIGVGKRRGDLHYLVALASSIPSSHPLCNVITIPSSLWHRRLGHPSPPRLQALASSFLHCSFDSSHVCDVCPLAKQTRQPFGLSSISTTFPFALIHCDIWGPNRQTSLSGAHYFLTIVDDFSRFTWVFLMKHKSDTQQLLKDFFGYVSTQFHAKIRCIRTDNGGEFLSLRPFFSDHGVLLQTSCVYTPQQNGVVERKHRHLLETARALHFQANLPLKFWGECILTAAYLINHLPTRLLHNHTPFAVLHNKVPTYDHFRVFGCLAYATSILPPTKFSPRAHRCIFLGYPPGQKAYKLYDLDTHRLFTSRDAIFHEDSFPYTLPPTSTPSPTPTLPLPSSLDFPYPPSPVHPPPPPPAPLADPSTSPSTAPPPPPLTDTFPDHSAPSPDVPSSSPPDPNPSSLPPPSHPSPTPRISSRTRTSPSYLKDYLCSQVILLPHQSSTSPPSSPPGTRYPLCNFISYHRYSPKHLSYTYSISRHVEPSSFAEAASDPNWRRAMHEELQALHANGTWTLTTLPPGKAPIDCKWVYKLKYNSDGAIERYKARLVAKGYTQAAGIDYHDTFSPTAKMITVRCLLALAASQSWSLHQLDVNNAFLHGDLHEEIYMSPPPGLRRQGENLVCRLHKSLYGLKQASRQWFAKFTTAILSAGFQQSKADYSLFTRKSGTSFTALLIYVDDIVITGNDVRAIDSLKSFLRDHFRIKDLGELKYFLGIEVSRSQRGIYISQRKYALEILKDYGFLGARPIAFPMDDTKLSDRGELLKDPEKYRRLVGRLIYLTITRPDITYSVHVLSRFMHEPRVPHMDAALRVVRYLKSTPGQGLLFRSNNQ
ncbi:unnamed protein product, partial [Prunus brigantina]